MAAKGLLGQLAIDMTHRAEAHRLITTSAKQSYGNSSKCWAIGSRDRRAGDDFEPTQRL
jgi:hypothetical protein